MNQQIFSGSGNKIRNEALYRAGIHPLSITGKIPAAKITRLIKEVVKYANIFYQELEKNGVNKNFAVYQQEYVCSWWQRSNNAGLAEIKTQDFF